MTQTPQDGHNLPTEDSTPPQSNLEAQGSNPTSTEGLRREMTEIIKSPMRSQVSTSDIVVGMWSSTALSEKLSDLEKLFDRYASSVAKAELEKLKPRSSKTDMVLREGKWIPYFMVPVETIDEAIAALQKDGDA